jgi:aspartate aminotransferase-like enzyme
MYIKKQRLLTPGPTPLYPPALHAMMASDMHHRTEDFRKAYRACLSDLKEVMGTANDVLMFACSGTGAMDATVSNLFSWRDKVIVCVAGKFGERWAEIAKAYGLDAKVLTVPYGQAVSAQQVEAALAGNRQPRGVFVQASETSTGAARCGGHGARGGKPARSWWWTRSPAWAPCRSISMAGAWMC